MSKALDTYALLPLRDIVVFPNMVVPLFVGRESSVKALEYAVNNNKKLLLCTQLSEETDEVNPNSIHKVGVLATVLQFLKIPRGTIKVLVQGHERVKIVNCLENEDFIFAEVQEHPYGPAPEGIYGKYLKKKFKQFATAKKSVAQTAVDTVEQQSDLNRLTDIIAGSITGEVETKQDILETTDFKKRFEKIKDLISLEISEIEVSKDIQSRVKTQMEQSQREHILNEQMKAIQRELGEDEETSELEDLEMRIMATGFTEEARNKANSELKKLRNGNPNSPEVQVSRNYLEWLLDIPWNNNREIETNISYAQTILDNDHYGLKRVKERIIEFIAVQKRTGSVGGTILCLVGPPGVGKTSLGGSVARATGREFLRISLGGIHDESEIRGHRRTYIGAMPGRIIKAFRKQDTTNPLILLDEIDKMANYRGDPGSAMLEVLDPEQNNRFYDNYLDVDYDLSNVMFITTANYLHDIPEPLRDRMDIIELDGYTEDEKMQIARRHLIPELLKTNGLMKGEFRLSNRVIQEIIGSYTREAGVRNLKRELASVMRKSITRIERNEAVKVSVKISNLHGFLGMQKYRYKMAEKHNQIGVATGLAWTPAGGDLLSIEATVMPGKGNMATTGKLGSVMKESVAAASSYIKSISKSIGIEPSRYESMDIHVHVPEGATPKEGPSAGVAMVTSMVSVLTGIPVLRSVAMTGEVTLRGNILPIGGLKAKLLAAIRGGIEIVLIPDGNMRDLSEIPDKIKEQLTILPVKHVSEILKVALEREPEPIKHKPEDVNTKISKPTVVQPEYDQSMSKH